MNAMGFPEDIVSEVEEKEPEETADEVSYSFSSLSIYNSSNLTSFLISFLLLFLHPSFLR